MRKFFLLLHRWLAILLGIFISIMCFTGAIMVFQDEIANYILGVEYSHDVPFFQAVRSLHRFLFIAPANPHEGLSVGRIIMGGSAIAMTLILLSGVVIWWPKTSRMLKNRLAINFHKGWHRFVYDTHVSLGIYTFAFLLLMSLTGPVFSFKSYRNAAISMLSMQEQPGGEYDIQKKTDRNPNHVDFNHHVGANPTQFFFMGFHTGRWGGLITRIIYFLSAIIGGFLPISGYYMWWKRRHKLKKKVNNENC